MFPDNNGANGRLIILVCFYVFYLFTGAVIFDLIEKPHEDTMIKELNQYILRFRNSHNSCVSDVDLNEFIQLVSHSNDQGIPATRNVTREQNWSFGQSVFYAGTVLTTIGYGNVSPLTSHGKLFLIVFAMVGLPVTLLLLYAVIERLMRLTGIVLACFTEKLMRITGQVPALSCLNRSHANVMFALLAATVFGVFFLIVPAAVYAHIEGWTYLDAFYYCFISLSTVGLGDFIPGDSDDQKHRHLYKLVSTIYLLVGVLNMVWVLEIFSETQKFNLYKYFTLTEDGILTKHHSKIHDMDCEIAVIGSHRKESEGATNNQEFNENIE